MLLGPTSSDSNLDTVVVYLIGLESQWSNMDYQRKLSAKRN